MTPRVFYSGLRPAPEGISSSQMEILRATLPEDVLQIILDYIEARGLNRAVHSIVAYGADNTGRHDSSGAFNDALDAATTEGGVVYCPAGTYKLTERVTCSSVRGFEIYGDGPQNTKFIWDGDAGEDMFRVENAQMVYLSGFELRGNSNPSKRPRACLHSSFDFGPGGGTYAYTTGLCRWSNIWCGGVGDSTGLPNMCQNGILINTQNTDYNNSEHVFENIHMDGCSEAAIKIDQTQAKTLKFYDCYIDASSKGVYCLNGAFAWYGGSVNCVLDDKSGIAFDIGGPNDPILIEGFQSEGTGRILRTGAGVLSGSGWPVTIRNSRFAGNLANPDGVMIEFGTRGPLVVEGNLFDSWEPVGGVPLQFKLTSSSGIMSADIRNNDINGTDSYLHSIIKDSAATGIRENGNTYYNTGGGSFFQRKHSGSLNFVSGDTTKTWTFDVPIHTGGAGAMVYSIATTFSERTGTTAQISKITKSATGFDVTLTAALTAGQTLTVDWQLEWM